MKTLDLKVKFRKETGKNASRRLRNEQLIPAVIYGKDEPQNLMVLTNDFDRLLENPDGINVLLNIKGDDIEKEAIIKKIQRDPVKDTVMHIDFMEIDENKELKITVPIVLTGTAEGVSEGGVLAQQKIELEIESLPKNLPSSIEVDVSELGIGDSLIVGDVEVEEDIKILEESEQLIANIVLPTEEEEEEEEEEVLTAEELEELEELEEGEEAVGEEGAEEGEEKTPAEDKE